MRGKSHDGIALINRLQILPAEVEFSSLAVMHRGPLLVVLAEGVLVDVQEKFRRRPLYLRGSAMDVSRTVRKSQQIQYLVLYLAFLALADYPVHHRLIEPIVHVQTARFLGAAKVAEDGRKDQQSGEGPDRHPD